MLHSRNLQLYLSLGIKLTKIYRVLKFKQSDWIKKYINFNTKKWTNAADSFEKDFLKFMINSVYGKTMESLRKRINARLVNNEKDLLKCTSRPTHITDKIFGKNYAAIHEIKPVLMLNKPIYVGFTVLELSKWLMYDFHYRFIKKQFEVELTFTDTDGLTYEIKSEDVHEEFFKYKYLFDFSNYPTDSKLFDEMRIIKKLLVKWKMNLKEKQLVNLLDWSRSCIPWKILMFNNLIPQKQWILQLSLMNSKTLYLTKKYSDIKWEEFKAKNIKWEHTKSTKYHYHVLMIKDLL